jgi:hypothetical protein
MPSPNRKELTRAGILLGCMALAGFLFIMAMPLLPGAAQNFLQDAQTEASGNRVSSAVTRPFPMIQPAVWLGLETELFLPACFHSDAKLGLVPAAVGGACPSHGG